MPNESRYQICVANITQLKSFNIPCRYIINASNPGFKSSGSGTNQAIYEACEDGPVSLKKLTLAKYSPPAVCAKAYPVHLVEGSSLYQQEVRYVIHVVGPNMNRTRPNYLKDDYDLGGNLLEESYLNCLNSFWESASH
eukprot:TRINITY_DN2552_c0_g1_i2.p1 TRINITY_DN2552_c0_g1~~TRINITY_DN2552_c0_g1_i2.p1  ORF type:complete len:138 (+),score=10.14 TRINITY_DN2552_c0_g1_i2:485-898(+)